MSPAEVARRRFKNKAGVARVTDAGRKYGERAQEIAWRVVHSELSQSEREKTSSK